MRDSEIKTAKEMVREPIMKKTAKFSNLAFLRMENLSKEMNKMCETYFIKRN